MISLNQAAKQGIRYVRLPQWTAPDDRLELCSFKGNLAEIATLISPHTHRTCPDIPERQPFFLPDLKDITLDTECWEPWESPLVPIFDGQDRPWCEDCGRYHFFGEQRDTQCARDAEIARHGEGNPEIVRAFSTPPARAQKEQG